MFLDSLTLKWDREAIPKRRILTKQLRCGTAQENEETSERSRLVFLVLTNYRQVNGYQRSEERICLRFSAENGGYIPLLNAATLEILYHSTRFLFTELFGGQGSVYH